MISDLQFGEFLQGIANEAQPQAAATGSHEGIGSEGGFLVQDTFMDNVWLRTHSIGEISRRCTIWPEPKGSSIFAPTVGGESMIDGERWGGLQAHWVSQGDQIPASTPAFGAVVRELDKLAMLWYVTSELASDVSQLGAMANWLLPLVLSVKLEDAILNGLGTAGPQGLLVSGARIVVDKESGQASSTIVAENLTNMVSRFWGASWRKAVWLVNQDIVPQLLPLTIAGEPVFSFGGNPASGGWPTLLGKPCIPCEHCKTLGTEGDVILVDLSQYSLVSKSTSDRSEDIKFLTDEIAYRVLLRVDGSLMWSGAVTPANGTTTQSPIVTLADRD